MTYSSPRGMWGEGPPFKHVTIVKLPSKLLNLNERLNRYAHSFSAKPSAILLNLAVYKFGFKEKKGSQTPQSLPAAAPTIASSRPRTAGPTLRMQPLGQDPRHALILVAEAVFSRVRREVRMRTIPHTVAAQSWQAPVRRGAHSLSL